jgi:hypothetical protein
MIALIRWREEAERQINSGVSVIDSPGGGGGGRYERACFIRGRLMISRNMAHEDR